MKTVITGNSGSGKTWLARQLSQKHAVPLVHLDELFWMPGGFDKKRPDSERGLLIEVARSQAAWIVEGVFGQLASQFLEDAGMLIWLDVDWPTCERRLHARGSESKSHMSRSQSSSGLAKLLAWASTYDSRDDAMSRRGHKALFDCFSRRKVYLPTEEEIGRFLATG
jgi:shikimate kinase